MTGNKPKLAGRAPAGPALKTKPAPIPEIPVWLKYVLGFFAVFVCAFIVYSPSLEGQFVFDDLNMPFVDPNARSWPLKDLVRRPAPADDHLLGQSPSLRR